MNAHPFSNADGLRDYRFQETQAPSRRAFWEAIVIGFVFGWAAGVLAGMAVMAWR